jgi:hypothetical protein
MSSTSVDAVNSLRKPPLLHVPQSTHVSHHHRWPIAFRPILIAAILDSVLPHTLDLAFHHPLAIRIHALSLLRIEMERQ